MSVANCLLLLALCVSCVYSLDFSFAANVSGDVSKKGWNFRNVQVSAYNLGLWMGANYLSYSASGSKGQAQADLLSGSCYVNLGMYPFSFISYWGVSADWTVAGNATNFATTTNFKAAGGYIGNAFLSLVEKDASGTVVATQDLRGAALIPSAANGIIYTQTASSSGGAGTSAFLKYVTYTGNAPGKLTVSITFLASSVAGVLNQAGTVVGPKTFESVIQIQNYQYASPTNTLSLVMGVGSGSASVNKDRTVLASKDGSTSMFFAAAKTAIVNNGTTGSVQISFKEDVIVGNGVSNFKSQLEGKYGANYKYQTVTVTFPAGASNIIYDPSIGEGSPMQQGSGVAVASNLFLVVAIALIAFLF